MAKTKSDVKTPPISRTAHVIDRKKLLADLRRATGFDLGMIESQGSLHIEYGYARVNLIGSYNYTHALGKRETAASEHESRADYDLEMDFGGEWLYTDLIKWAANILSTGRTVACGQGIGLHKRLRSNPPEQTCDYTWKSIVQMIDGTFGGDTLRDAIEPLDLRPDYQRGAVWGLRQQEEFVGFLLEGGDSPKVVIQQWSSADNAPAHRKADYWKLLGEVVDGQQRLRAIWRWMKGEIAGLSPVTGEYLWYKDTNEVDRRGLSLKLTLIDVPRAERIRFYIKLNTGGTAHTATEIERARQLLAEEATAPKLQAS